MTIKLNKIQFDYLNNNLAEEKCFSHLKFQIMEGRSFAILEADEHLADEIRDWASNELQKKGFDMNYELTNEGKMLESLIDLLYIK